MAIGMNCVRTAAMTVRRSAGRPAADTRSPRRRWIYLGHGGPHPR
jgi:hypothetical protein